MRYFIVAGEASGDLHGSRLMKAIKNIDQHAVFCFLGGDKMAEEAEISPIVHYRNMAFMGFINVLLNISKILWIRSLAKNKISEFKPDKLILIDYPGFNLRFAKYVKKHLPQVQINYYIAPKLWAWKSYRIRSVKKYVDRMYAIFPFETQFFASYNYKVYYVGNPSVDSVNDFLLYNNNSEKFLKTNQLDNSRPIVALMAGSRKQEIKSCLPIMIEMTERFPGVQFVVAAAPSVEHCLYDNIVKNKAKIVYGDTYNLLSVSSAAVVNSGTATLETALFKVPQVVVYKVFGGSFALLLKDLVIKTKWVSLVNIIAGKEVVKELLANQFNVENTVYILKQLLYNKEYIDSIKQGYNEITKILGKDTASEICASYIVSAKEEC